MYTNTHVASPPLLLSSSTPLLLSSFVHKLFDLRKPSAPLFEYSGHDMRGLHGKGKLIYHPAFIGNGSSIVTPGDRADYLSMYCTRTGRTISRGGIGETASAVVAAPASGATSGDLLGVACGRYIRFMEPC